MVALPNRFRLIRLSDEPSLDGGLSYQQIRNPVHQAGVVVEESGCFEA